MEHSFPASLNIVGAGHVGKTLGRLWHKQGVFAIRDVFGRSMERAADAVSFIGAGRAVNDFALLRPAGIYLLTVPDDQILACSERLAHCGLLGPDSIVAHCSGSLSSSEMQAAIAAKSAVAGMHPVRSFAVPEQVAQSFSGTYCGIEGDERAVKVMEHACRAIGGLPVAIDPEYKIIYHSAAVFASNYLVTLLDIGLQAYARAGVPKGTALKMMEPLVRKTIDNVFGSGTEVALSGPIARGDAKTAVKQYRALLAWNKPLGNLYKALGKHTANLARRKHAKTGQA